VPTRERLLFEPDTLSGLLFGDTQYAAGDMVLVAGCSDGSQVVPLARQSPGATFLTVAASAESLIAAQSKARAARLKNVRFQRLELDSMSFAAETFDHVFACLLLGHLAEPQRALAQLRNVLKAGGSITVIEGDEGSAFFHPDSVLARKAIQSAIEARAREGGNATIGRSLYPLLTRAGFMDVNVSPRVVYRDERRARWADKLVIRRFAATVAAAAERVEAHELMDKAAWTEGLTDLQRAVAADATFSYTFFRAVALKPMDGLS
jgi:SAM-dependent methyltransferase